MQYWGLTDAGCVRKQNQDTYLMEQLDRNGFRENHKDEFIPCFEYEYDKDGETYMDVFIHVDSTGKANLFTGF